MMLEIMNNGPVVCSFEPNYSFMTYNGKGIYSDIKTKTWKDLKLSQPEWQQVDHSVLCTGWGEENGKK